MGRDIEADGWHNARDLGGLPTTDGGRIRAGAVIRADAPDGIGDAGWAMLRERGVRTVLDLRDDQDDIEHTVPEDFDLVRLPLEQLAGKDFWAEHHGTDATPLYYRAYLTDVPRGAAEVVRTVARARPGGVLVHCSGGKDRTGLAVLVLLALAGVSGEEIAADYELSYARLHEVFLAMGAGDQRAKVEAKLAEHGTTIRQTLLDVVEWLDAGPYLRAFGVSEADIAAAREQLRE